MVYDDSLTDHLFDLLCRLATHEDQLVYLAQERRCENDAEWAPRRPERPDPVSVSLA